MKKESIKFVAQATSNRKNANFFFAEEEIEGIDVAALNKAVKAIGRACKPSEKPFLVKGRPGKNEAPSAYCYAFFGNLREAETLDVNPCFYTGYSAPQSSEYVRGYGHASLPVEWTLVWPLPAPRSKHEAIYNQYQVEESIRAAIEGKRKANVQIGKLAAWTNGFLTSKEKEFGKRKVTLAELADFLHR